MFRKLYYHFYSNSRTSRAECIFEDIAKLLLLKMISERYSSVIFKDFHFISFHSLLADSFCLPPLSESLLSLATIANGLADNK